MKSRLSFFKLKNFYWGLLVIFLLFVGYHIPLAVFSVRVYSWYSQVQTEYSKLDLGQLGEELNTTITNLDEFERLSIWYPWLGLLLPQELEQSRELLSQNREYLLFFSEIFEEIGVNPTESRLIRVLLQNNHELRPSGGFLGSYAEFLVQNSGITEFKIQDIYEPDGQLDGYVQPPKPIEQYLYQSGGWKLRDANWDPRFSETAKAVDWFFVQAEYPSADGYVGVNLTAVEKLLELVGSVSVSDYDVELHPDSLASFLQSETEQDFFPGSTNKRDVLSAVAGSLFRTILELPQEQKMSVLREVFEMMQNQELVFWYQDPTLQQKATELGITGNLQFSQVFDDYLYLVEANLGINKANCCVDRAISLNYRFLKNGEVFRTTHISYQNFNPITPNPPYAYGGGYLVHVRPITLTQWSCENISIQDQYEDIVFDRTVTCEHSPFPGSNMKNLELISHVRGGENGSLEFEEKSHHAVYDSRKYLLFVRKQSGMIRTSFRLRVDIEGEDSIQVNGLDIKSGDTIEFDEYQSQLIQIELPPTL